MEDTYVEQIVKKEESKKDTMKRFLIVGIACVLSMFFVIVFANIPEVDGVKSSPIQAIPFIIVIGIVCNIFFKRLNKEYEYMFTNGTLDIDCIYNKSKRKNVFSVHVSEFIVMAHIDDKEYLAGFSAVPTRDFSSGEIFGNTYMVITYYNQEKVKFIIEPNEKLLNAIKKYIEPTKLYLKK